MITSNVQFSNSGAAAASISRKDVIGDENKLKKVEFTHIENPQVAALDSRQLADSTPGAPRRSDEEIQVVFDRYKDALYRIYSRELRKNSLLKGKLVLQLTIEPDGKVSRCKVESSELNSEELEKKITARVMRFNFGAKKGARPLTILYPINFLPAT
jgi:outer membrane biosynthesis protein TonB